MDALTLAVSVLLSCVDANRTQTPTNPAEMNVVVSQRGNGFVARLNDETSLVFDGKVARKITPKSDEFEASRFNLVVETTKGPVYRDSKGGEYFPAFLEAEYEDGAAMATTMLCRYNKR